jgi:hypothetical protein
MPASFVSAPAARVTTSASRISYQGSMSKNLHLRYRLNVRGHPSLDHLHSNKLS